MALCGYSYPQAMWLDLSSTKDAESPSIGRGFGALYVQLMGLIKGSIAQAWGMSS
ncbi:hypothetical protein [Aeromonas phage 59.1]|nr:hypothetical protein [Aeromonas phage 59.1]